MKKKIEIIAEVGVNHNGSIVLAKKYIRECSKMKVDYVKFQFAIPDLVATNYVKSAKYQKKNIKSNKSQLDLIKKIHLKPNQYLSLIKYSKKYNIKILFSFFDSTSLKILLNNKVKAIKIPSGEINNFFLLRHLKNFNGKIFLSTGMSNLKEVINVYNFLLKLKIRKSNICIMQCTSNYPTSYSNLNLNVISSFKKKFGDNIGFSDHTITTEASLVAIGIGVVCIEKHITFDRSSSGPDHKASMSLLDFKKFVIQIRNAELSFGSSIKKINLSEIDNKILVRKVVVAKRNIKKGEIFSYNNLDVKRAGSGMEPIKINNLVGKKSKKNYMTDEKI